MTELSLSKPNGWIFYTVVGLFVSLLGTLMFCVIVFPVIFFFGTFESAKNYTVPVSAIISVLFCAFIMLIQREGDHARYRHEVATDKALKDSNFPVGRVFFSPAISFVINQSLDKIFILESGESQPQFLSRADIVDMVFEVDDTIVSKVNSGSGGSLITAGVGGLLFGGAGAVVGAIAGKNQTSEHTSGVRSIQIKLAVNKTGGNLIKLVFFESSTGFKKGDWALTRPMQEANEWWASLAIFTKAEPR